MQAREAVICDAVRTPVGKRNGRLAGWHPADLLGFILNAILERNSLDPELVDDVIGGNVTQCAEQGVNVTRNGWVSGGLPWTVPATTVDRQCGSSQQAAHFAAQGVIAGAYDLVIACGVESMTRVPMSINAWGGESPFGPGFLAATDGQLKTQFEVAQHIADEWKITRDEMDAFALESHRRAAAAIDAGAFERETVPIHIRDAEMNPTPEVMRVDEGPRRDTSMQKLASLRSAVDWDETGALAPDITAGNSSQMSDGSSAMIIASRETAERLGLPVRARFCHFTVAAEDAVWVLTAPNRCTRKALARSGMQIDDFDAIEVNEAFASVVLAWQREFAADPEKLNPRGGGIALGHPLGATGVKLLTTMLHYLEDTGGRFGFQTMCEGGGQANATVIERLG